MTRRVRYFWLSASTFVASLSVLAQACAGGAAGLPEKALTPSPAPEPNASATPAPVAPIVADEQGPRLFPPLDGAAVSVVGEDKDGSRRIVSYGLRLLARADGAIELAREYLPAARSVRVLELPARLGAGFLFYVQSSSATLFFRSRTFTGDLEPFARLDFEAEQVIAGFDRLYVVASHPDRIVALDAEKGTAQSLGSLPASPSYGKMAFVDAWFGALSVPLRGALVSFDAGVSWHSLGVAATSMEVQDGALRLTGPEGVLDLDRTGTFTRRDQPNATPQENPVAQALRGEASGRSDARVRERIGRDALKLAVLRGLRGPDGALLVADSGQLLRIRKSDGKLLESDEHAYPGGGECTGLNYGQSSGFVCNDGPNQTALYAFEPPFRMRRVRTFNGARYVAASGNGSLVIRGSCAEPVAAQAGVYCIARKTGQFSEIRVRGDLGVERVVALADGRVAVIVPPRLGAAGFLSLIDGSGQEQRTPLELPTSGPAKLLEKGLWLDGFVEVQPPNEVDEVTATSAAKATSSAKATSKPKDGPVLAGWVVGSEPFAGVRVALDGSVTMGHPETGIDRALLSASHALLVGRTGRTRESTDGGFEWTDVDLPSEFDPARELRDDARLQGCSELGCAFAGFVRVGFRSHNAAPRLRIAALSDTTRLLQPGGSRWVLRCEATAESSEAAQPPVTRTRVSPRSDDPTTPSWAPFLELPPPALGAGEAGYDVGPSDSEGAAFRAYVWGERGADWARVGHLQVRLFDRFQVRRGVFQSALTRSPWSDAAAAAEAFGFDASGNPTSWRAVLDPNQRAAAVLASSRGLLDLLLFEEGKTVVRLTNAGRLGFNFGMLSSVAKLTDAWYLASFNENHGLILSKMSGGRVERLAEYPDPGHDIGSATLVHGVRGDELGIWVTGRGWYLYPIDSVSHALQAPLSATPAELSVMPPPCVSDVDGFLLTGAPSLEPNLRLMPANEGIGARRVEAQFIWSARGLCTRALAAESDGAPSHTAGKASAVNGAAVPLTVTDRRPLGRRWGYVCAP